MKPKDQPQEKVSTPIPFSQELTQLLNASKEFASLPTAARVELRGAVQIFNMEPGTRYYNTSQAGYDFIYVLGGALNFYYPKGAHSERKKVLRRNESLAFDSASSMLGKMKEETSLSEIRASSEIFRDTQSKLSLGAKLARIPYEYYKAIVNNFSKEEVKKSEQFLYECVPLLQNYTSSLRQKCKLFFLKKVSQMNAQHYYANDYLLRQGQPADKAYIILEGEVELVRRRTIDMELAESGLKTEGATPVPVSSSQDGEGVGGKKSPEKHKTTTRPNQEDIKLASIGQKSWIGEDSILGQSRMKYSAVVVNKAVIFQISEDLLTKLPKETKTHLLKMSLEKKEFLQERFQTLCTASGAIQKDRPLLNASLNHIGKAYPIASEKARKNFQKMHLQNSNYNHKVSIALKEQLVMVQKNARVQNLEQDPFFKRHIGLEEGEKVRLQQLHRFFFYDKRKLHQRIEENKRKSQSIPLNKTLPPQIKREMAKEIPDRLGNQRSSQSFILPEEGRHEASRNLTVAMQNYSTNGSKSSFANQLGQARLGLKNKKFLHNQQEALKLELSKSASEETHILRFGALSPRSAPRMGKVEVLPSIQNIQEKTQKASVPPEGKDNYNTLQNQADILKIRQSGRNAPLSKSALGTRETRTGSKKKPRLVPRKDIPIVPSLPYYKKDDYKRELSAFTNFPLSFQNYTSRIFEVRQSGEGLRSKFLKPLFHELLPSKSGKYSLGEKVKF